jgi:signal transduction histidine kinase
VHQVSPHASELLQQAIPRVLRIWEERLRAEEQAARRQSQRELFDTLPAFLGQLVEALRSGAIRSAEAISEIGKVHGAERARLPGYELTTVLQEYRILHHTIVDVLEESVSLSAQERMIIVDSIFHGIREASGEYMRLQQDLRLQFLMHIAHDLRGPLTAAKANASMVERLAARIMGDMDRCDEMIRDFLDAQRLRVGDRQGIRNRIFARASARFSAIPGEGECVSFKIRSEDFAP